MAQRLFRRASGAAGEHASLGDEWKEDGCQRLGLVSAAASLCAALAVGLTFFVEPNIGAVRAGISRPFYLVHAFLGLSLATTALARWSRLKPQARLDFGLLYLVAGCALVAVFRHALPYDVDDVLRGPSGVAFAVVVFAVIVPVQPARMAVAAFAAAAADPLALWAFVVSGHPAPRPMMWAWLFLPTIVAALAATAISRQLHALGRVVAEAREMGSYRLVERLGAGGMGEVWRADHHTLRRPAAIKLVKAERLGRADDDTADRAMQRFEREAQATARLSSPHTVALYDFGVASDGALFYVMELLDGMDLETLVKTHGAVPQGRAVRILLQTLHSLADAHASGLIHRDVKPANIYICRRGREVDYVKVLDFGLVKHETEDEGSDLTGRNTILGTPAYLAPEAARSPDIDLRADLYSLGCVAFWLLTATTVFERRRPLEMIAAHLMDKPEPPSHLASAPIADALDRVVLRCLEKDPAARFQSCDELVEALHGTGLAADWNDDQARRWWQAHRPAP